MCIGRNLVRGTTWPARVVWRGGRGSVRLAARVATGPQEPVDEDTRRRRRLAVTVLVLVTTLAAWGISFGTVRVNYEIGLGLGPFIAAWVSLPLLLIVTRPALGWSLSIAGAVILTELLPLTHELPWPWQVIHGLVLFALLFAVCAKQPLRGLGAWLLTVILFWWGVPRDEAPGWTVAISVVAVLGLLAGRLVRTNRALAAQEQVSATEREARVVLEERTRIARDLHDIVAHHMSLVVVQAETAPYRVADLSDGARAELESISESARSALAETRALLAVLRQEGDAAVHAPQPGIGELGPLLEGARRAGVQLVAELHVAPSVLRPGTSLAAYRIVQEGLANASRHAPGAPVRVELVPEDGGVRVSVVNGPVPGHVAGMQVPAPREGHGLTGMRERVGAEGGTLWAGPTSDGGFTVWATLPAAPSPSPAAVVVEEAEGQVT